MKMHNCSVCDGRDLNKAGIELAEQEVFPFFKQEVLKLKYPTHPFPRKYEGIIYSILAFSQSLAYDRVHGNSSIYYTEDKWLLKYSKEMCAKFGTVILHASECRTLNVRTVCEFNVEPKN